MIPEWFLELDADGRAVVVSAAVAVVALLLSAGSFIVQARSQRRQERLALLQHRLEMHTNVWAFARSVRGLIRALGEGWSSQQRTGTLHEYEEALTRLHGLRALFGEDVCEILDGIIKIAQSARTNLKASPNKRLAAKLDAQLREPISRLDLALARYYRARPLHRHRLAGPAPGVDAGRFQRPPPSAVPSDE